MSWLYGQTWLWYLIAFVVGVLLAWLFLVRPQQRRLRAVDPGTPATSDGVDDRTAPIGAVAAAAGGATAGGATLLAARDHDPIDLAKDPAPAAVDDEPTTRVEPLVDDSPTEVLPAVDPALSTLDSARMAHGDVDLTSPGSGASTEELTAVPADGVVPAAGATAAVHGHPVTDDVAEETVGEPAPAVLPHAGSAAEETPAAQTSEAGEHHGGAHAAGVATVAGAAAVVGLAAHHDASDSEPAPAVSPADEPAAEDTASVHTASVDPAPGAAEQTAYLDPVGASEDTAYLSPAGASDDTVYLDTAPGAPEDAVPADPVPGPSDDTVRLDMAPGASDDTVYLDTLPDAAGLAPGSAPTTHADEDLTTEFATTPAGSAVDEPGIAPDSDTHPFSPARAGVADVDTVGPAAGSAAAAAGNGLAALHPGSAEESTGPTSPVGGDTTSGDTTSSDTTSSDTTSSRPTGSLTTSSGTTEVREAVPETAAATSGPPTVDVADPLGDGASTPVADSPAEPGIAAPPVEHGDTAAAATLDDADPAAGSGTPASAASAPDEVAADGGSPVVGAEDGSGAATGALAGLGVVAGGAVLGGVGAAHHGSVDEPAGRAAGTPADDITAAPYGPGSRNPLPDGSSPSADHAIKGNVDSMLFHTTDSPYYVRTRAEAWFATAEAAQAAGFTPWNHRRKDAALQGLAAVSWEPGPYAGSAMPAADGSSPSPDFTIKGNSDSMLYHDPDSPYYTRTRAEAWFRTAADAEKAGFTGYIHR